MNDLDPNYTLPLWQALVRYFRTHHPLVHAHGADAARPSPLDPVPGLERVEGAGPANAARYAAPTRFVRIAGLR